MRRQPNLDFRLLPDDTNAHGEDTVAFLAQLRGEIRGPMTILGALGVGCAWGQTEFQVNLKLGLTPQPG